MLYSLDKYMQREFQIHNQKIVVDIKRSKRAKRLRISVAHDGSVSAVHPWYVSSSRVILLIENKIEWIEAKVSHFKMHPREIISKGGKREYLANKEAALAIAKNKMEHFNQFYKLRYRKISIRKQKTRWGSCSKKGNLNFNYKIVFLSPELQDYLVVHELCHLKEMNHSKKFWDLVSLQISNAKNTRKMLKRLA